MRALQCWLFLGLMAVWTPSIAQSILPLEHSRMMSLEAALERDARGLHSDIRPFISDAEISVNFADSVLTPGCTMRTQDRSWFIRKMFFEHFLKADTGNFYIAADPLLDMQAGYDVLDSKFIYRNGRGLQILGGVGNQLSFYSSYLETQSGFSSYIDDFVKQYEVVPGMNRVKDFKSNSYDYGLATANVSYSPWAFLNIQMGYGKNFFGDGYRSLLLSDNAFNYPFLKISTRLGRFEYVNLITSFQNLDIDSVLDAPNLWYNGYQKKGGTFNYLSVHATKWLQIGVFEGVIWKSRALKDRAFNINQFIPIIFLNTFRYSLYEENNVILGLNFAARPIRNLKIYGQGVLDDVHFRKPGVASYQKTKWGYQLGVKYYHVAGLKNLMLQVEFNRLRPYTYGHQDPLQSYTHNNQALAHPLGANFSEIISLVNYRYKRLFAVLHFQFASGGTDEDGSHWGSNIFLSDTRAELGYHSEGNHTGQGVKKLLTQTGFTAGYLFNPRYGLSVEAGLWYRDQSVAGAHQKNMSFWLGLKTRLFNQYFDF